MKIRLKIQNNIFGINHNTIYNVLAIEDNYYRIINDKNSPTLYEISIFSIIDNNIPSDWIIKFEDNEIDYLGPKIFSGYFFEDYFDGNEINKNILSDYLQSIGV